MDKGFLLHSIRRIAVRGLDGSQVVLSREMIINTIG